MTDSRTVWRVAGLEDLRAMALRRSEHVFPRHAHETYSIGINLRGAHESRCRGSGHVLPPGAVAALNPDEPHTGSRHGIGPWSFFGVYPSVQLMRALAALIRRHAADRPSPGSAGDEREGLRRVRDYIHDHLADSPTLAELARVAGLSRYHFLRVFRARFGLTPHAYLTQARITRARELLAAGEPIGSVAFAVGFADQSHLTNRFKQWVGVTPAEYRSATRI